MKILHISDTHAHHTLLPESIFEGVDTIVVSGDVANYHDVGRNANEVLDFIEWFDRIPLKHKIWIAGNHDGSIQRGLIRPLEASVDTIYLQDSHCIIDGIKFWGSPWTPSFGDWYFMKKRGKLAPIYNQIDLDTDVIIQHGPPKGILDLTENPDGSLERCGCKEFLNACEAIRPKAVLFGHIHNCTDIVNQGVLIRDGIIYSNGSIVTDGKFGKITSTGNIIEVNT